MKIADSAATILVFLIERSIFGKIAYSTQFRFSYWQQTALTTSPIMSPLLAGRRRPRWKTKV